MALQMYQFPCDVQSFSAENWLGETISTGAGVGDGVGVCVGVGLGVEVGLDVGTALGVGLAVGLGLGDGIGDGTCDGAAEGPPESVCGLLRAVVLEERICGKAKEDIAMRMVTMTIDEIVMASHR